MFYDLWDVMTYMLWNENIDCENKKLDRNDYNCEEICYEIQIKISTFQWVQFSKRVHIYVNKAISMTFDNVY